MITAAEPIVTSPAGHPTTPTPSSATSRPVVTRDCARRCTMTPEAVAEEVNKASLLGRGGAGFPAGRKWSMLRKARDDLPRRQRRRERAGDVQGPPAHRARPAPDHRGRDHRRLRDRRRAGLHLLPRRVRARARAPHARPATRRTRTARSARNIFGSTFSLDLVIHPGAGAYICGEETALLESLEGKRGFPADQAPVLPRGRSASTARRRS